VLHDWVVSLDPLPSRALWCAGGGFVGVTDDTMEREAVVLTGLLRSLAEAPFAVRSFGFSSSAGGVYAGCPGRADESTPPAPVSAYGRGKLAHEQLVLDWSRRHGVPVSVARYANLYGPGQDLQKPQGLVTRLARASLVSQPVNIFVPLDTRRDYVFARDAARTALDLLEPREGEDRVVKIVATGRSTTIGELISVVRRTTRRHCPVTLAITDAGRSQPAALNFGSVVRTDLDDVQRATLPEGVAAVVRDLCARLGRGGYAALGL
jgi:UDP-glucose 4-epimerase